MLCESSRVDDGLDVRKKDGRVDPTGAVSDRGARQQWGRAGFSYGTLDGGIGTNRSPGGDMSLLESSKCQLITLAVCVAVGAVLFTKYVSDSRIMKKRSAKHKLLGDGFSGHKHAL